jgi:hypothetical protein
MVTGSSSASRALASEAKKNDNKREPVNRIHIDPVFFMQRLQSCRGRFDFIRRENGANRQNPS